MIIDQDQSQQEILKIIIPCTKELEIVNLRDIIFIEAMQNYSRVNLSDERILNSTKNLGYYIDQLSAFQFISCHKSYFINEDHITKMCKDNFIKMSNNKSVPYSRRRKNEIIEHLIQKRNVITTYL